MTTVWKRLVHMAIATVVLFGIADAAAAGGPQVKPPCSTTGPVDLGVPSPNDYTYTKNEAGSVSGTIAVTAPSANFNPSCNAALPPEFGNTGLTAISLGIDVTKLAVTYASGPLAGEAVSSGTQEAIAAQFSFGSVTLSPGGSGSVSFVFTNSASIPAGDYDVVFHSGSGSTVPDGTTAFSLTVNDVPTLVDTLAPTVTITSPTSNSKVLLNGMLAVAFTATDPVEGGAGTGVTAVGAAITTANNAVNEDITGDLTVTPALPAAAGTAANASAAVQMAAVGTYSLRATADDGAGHTGEKAVSFTVGVNVAALPPLSIAGRQFNTGSTVPVKWVLKDADNHFVPPFASVKATIKGPGLPTSGFVAVAGAGAANIRWETDASGNATQYIVNFSIPGIGTYTVDISLTGIDGTEVSQGQFSFVSAAKGGK